MDFVNFYIVQVVKNAASRIRLTDKEKEKLLSTLIWRIENSQELFRDLKLMERVVELEETASKLISIYKRLNKSHIDLEKISYQFASDRDSVLSTLRRFIQGSFREGIIRKRRPKIVFDDTTYTIYELKEPEELEIEDKSSEEELKPRIELKEFLKPVQEEFIQIKSEGFSEQIEVTGDVGKIAQEISDELVPDTNMRDETLELDNGIAKKSLSKKVTDLVEEKGETNLVLPLEFDWVSESSRDKSDFDEQDFTSKEYEQDKEQEKTFEINQEQIQAPEKKLIDESNNEVYEEKFSETLTGEFVNAEYEKEETNANVVESDITGEVGVSDELVETSIDAVSSDQLIGTLSEANNTLYLDFEKLVLDNILEIDDFLNKVLDKPVDDDLLFNLIQKSFKSFQLAQELNFDFIAELIKVYWLSLVAIRDGRLKPIKSIAELIRSTLIILVTLLKQREIDLEPFMKKYNKLKEKLTSIGYEV